MHIIKGLHLKAMAKRSEIICSLPKAFLAPRWGAAA
jgi:hypothetical protein